MTLQTFMKTKSGTKIYITDTNAPDAERQKARVEFLKIYNKTFTINEQKEIGNIVFNYDKYGKGLNDKFTHAQFEQITNPSVVREMNPGKSRMAIITVSKDSYNDEYAIVHELLHARNFIRGMSKRKNGSITNERKQDFETLGRITKQGFKKHLSEAENAISLDKQGKKRKKITFGGYYADDSNKNLVKMAGKDPKKQIAIAVDGIKRDRKLLTGSTNTNIIGKVASSRAEKLYPQSFFNQKAKKESKP